MDIRRFAGLALASLLVLPMTAAPQTTVTPVAASAPTAVPSLVPYSGVAIDGDGRLLRGETGITFQIYKDEAGGEALWTESQTLAIDPTGHYKVQLGATHPNGLPSSLFASGEARWLEVQIAGQSPQSRVLIASVPYALKAGDATTLGGLPASAYALAGRSVTAAPAAIPDGVSTVTTTGGTAGYVPEFSGAATIVDSPILVLGADVGIGTATPTATLDVNGAALLAGELTANGGASLGGALNLSAAGTATASTGYNSELIKIYTSAYNSSSKAVVDPRFEWEAVVAGNDTASPSATLNLLSSTTSGSATETGFYFNANGTINFAPEQTFPGTGRGTITGVAAGTALTGGGTSGAVTLNLDTTKVPLLAANNSFTGNQSIAGNLTASGTASAGSVNAVNSFSLGGWLFGFGSKTNRNAFLGFAGNISTTGGASTAIGFQALYSDTGGYLNTATGFEALTLNTTGSENTATGVDALKVNTTGSANTASGVNALYQNSTAGDNTAEGYAALYWDTTGSNNVGDGAYAGQTVDFSTMTGSNDTVVGALTKFGTGSISNATAIGASAVVDASNATAIGADAVATESNTLVLGCIGGTNGCTNSVSVGIGTTTPDELLSVNGSADKAGGGSWDTYSDERLKTVNGSFGGGLNQVMQLRPIRYRYKLDNAMGIRDAGEHIGVVAQQVQRVIPDAVTENSKGYLLVNNDPIIWSMVNAIKEQQREIAAQQKLIREQSQAMKGLVAEIRETRKALRQVKAQVGGVSPVLVAAK